jgi:two-component system phosphate regulon sensor histidine kinase PhoR
MMPGDGITMIWPWRREGEGESAGTLRVPGARRDALTELVAALPDPVLLLDRNGIVTAANRRALDILDFDPSDHHISAAIRAPQLLDAVAHVLKANEAVRVDYEMHVPVRRHFEAFVSYISGEEAAAALILLRDLTREQQIERMRADFVAHASHELRTPLASLLGFIETLQGPARNDEPARQRFLDLMLAQAERMRRLIDDLLSLSRIEMNAHLRPQGTVDLGQVARHVRDTLAGLAREVDLDIVIGMNAPMPVKGDWDELVQVVQNLLENAIKYASSGKRVDIDGGGEGRFFELTVRDHGPGIAEEHIPRLTERFYRINVQESRSRGGTGLGLAIVKHILNRHRGRLIIRSELGKGSSFTVRVPAAEPELLGEAHR